MRQIRKGFVYINAGPQCDDKAHVLSYESPNRLCDNTKVETEISLFGIMPHNLPCEKCMYIVATEPYEHDSSIGESR